MESVLGRYRNLIVLVAALFIQVLGLAVQVKRTTTSEPTRLIRIWAVGAVTPLEKALLWTQTSTSNLWHNYLYLRGVRAENRQLKLEIEQMRLEQARMSQDADQAHRLQALLSFKEKFISKTLAAQVIGASGSEQSRSVYIDKGAREGIKPDMAVITNDGIVGKVLQVYGTNPLEASTAQVLLINDQTSGVGAILEKTRLQGILRGTPAGEVVLEKVMSDETVPVGELVLTSGGDGIFPKGLPVGTVTRVSTGNDLFLNIRVRPAANLSRLEEVLVVTKIDERQAQPEQTGPMRAVDILAERLPSVPAKPAVPADAGGKSAGAQANASANPKAGNVASGAPQNATAAKQKTAVGTSAQGAGIAGSTGNATPSAAGATGIPTNNSAAPRTTGTSTGAMPAVRKPASPTAGTAGAGSATSPPPVGLPSKPAATTPVGAPPNQQPKQDPPQ
jgi:rod shape-determining protein MreC